MERNIPTVDLSPAGCVHCGRELAADAARFCTWCAGARPTFYAAHGGAGATLLAGLLAGVDGGRADQVQVSTLPARRLSVLVGRTYLAGLSAIQARLNELPGFFDLVLLNRDAPGRLPKPVADRSYIITGAAPATLSCPFVQAWRTDTTDVTDKDAARFLTAFRTRFHNTATTLDGLEDH